MPSQSVELSLECCLSPPSSAHTGAGGPCKRSLCSTSPPAHASMRRGSQWPTMMARSLGCGTLTRAWDLTIAFSPELKRSSLDACARRSARHCPPVTHLWSRPGACGSDVAQECYLVDPASSHMLVSKIKPCMCKYELIQTVKLRMAH